MSFFKKLFSFGKDKQEQQEENGTNFKGIYSTEHFNERYTEQDVYENPKMLEGCLKMVEGYFVDNKMEPKVQQPVNHPDNLDQVIDEGFGFQLYCKAFQLGDAEATMFLAYAFSEYLIKNYGFKLYNDKQPEFPLRSMTLKYDKNGMALSIYPFEYASKALKYESSFKDLHEKIKTQIENLPAVNDVIEKFMKPSDNS